MLAGMLDVSQAWRAIACPPMSAAGAFFLLALIIPWMGRRLVIASRANALQRVTQASILSAVQDGILGLGPDGRVLYFNPAADALLGHCIVPGCPLPNAQAGSPELLAHVMALVSGGMAGHADPLKRTVQTGDDKARRHFALTLSTPGNGGAGRACILAIRDVTAEAEAALHSAECEARIDEASRVLSYAMITGGVIHEISQPLSAMRNYIHVLKASPEFREAPASYRMIAGFLGEEAARLAEIIRNVRLMGPDEGRFEGNCRLAEAIDLSVRLVMLGVSQRTPISVSMAGGADLRVRGSASLTGQVIVNLLKNALQASQSAQHRGVEIIVRETGRFAEISVADFGPGINPEAAARLFTPFTRSSGGGMGLGLSLCQRIARKLGGSVSWENRETGGALFKFNVPLAGRG